MNLQMLLFANLIINLILLGLIYTIQFVHYPLFKNINPSNFTTYEKHHTKKITPLVAPLMIFEIAICSVLFFYDANLVNIVCIILLLAIWLSTFFIQVPLHKKLQISYDKNLINKLIKTNMIRTICWTLKAVLLIKVMI